MKIAQAIFRQQSFSTKVDHYQQFLTSKKQQLYLKKQAGRSSIGHQIHVPHLPLSRLYVQSFFVEKQLQNKSILVNVDPAHLLGIKRSISLQYLNKNVYKGHSEPVDILKKNNPSNFVTVNELAFNQQIFAITDPLFTQQSKTTESSQLLDQIYNYYNTHLERGVERLSTQYNVPSEYLYIIESAHNNNNIIYFCGLNAYELRQILTSYLSLQQTKILYMDALKYCAQHKAMSGRPFHQKCIEYIWSQHYSYLQPINYQLIKKVRTLVKGYCFAHSYNFNTPQNVQINFKNMRDKEPDNSKIQKNAILQVLLGNLWTKHYTNNPFPYLAEPFSQLAPDDKKLVVSIYNQIYNKYKAAKDKFIQMQTSQ